MSIDDELSSDFIAFAKAGFDKNFTLFKVYTRQLRDPKSGEVGQFHFECSMDFAKFESHGDPVGLLKYLVRKYLLHGRTETGVDFNQWVVEFSPVMEKYYIPSHLYLDSARDRAWLT